MGYHTDFIGAFEIDRPVTDEIATLLRGLATTRRMKRDNEQLIQKGYGDCGVDGEFFCVDDGHYGQECELDTVLDYNQPPSTQPGLWCQWLLAEDNQTLEWDTNEKFYCYIEWIQYLIERILKPNNYVLNGAVAYRGEEFSDFGYLEVVNNQVIDHFQEWSDHIG
ncbi:hypothetical protein [Enterococcus sp. AZ149]|uniref:hypothetical protein n=1 Tax=Enterococcus sp. AZ149 TaxID=2774686 RepID=UPI003F21F7BB